MRKLISLLLVLSASVASAVGPRTWQKRGTATTTNATLTVGNPTNFNPAAVCVKNSGSTNDLWIDWTDGVAVAADDSTNLQFSPGEEKCFSLGSQNVLNRFQIGVITSASTTTYEVKAIADR